MPYRFETIPVSRLLLDESNARLGEVQPDQRATEIALANLLGSQLLEIAQDIASRGLDPSLLLIATPDGAPSGKFRVIEGNRRLLALRALSDPSSAHTYITGNARRKRLAEMSATFQVDPITKVRCVIFDSEDEASHWILMRHTGANDGVGLVGWDPNEQDRYKSRHMNAGVRNPAGQIVDFVNKYYPGSNSGFVTTLDRLISTPAVRLALGIDIEKGVVYSHFAAQDVIQGLAKLVSDLRSGAISVKDVFYLDDRTRYIDDIVDHLPDQSKRLEARVVLTDLSGPAPSANGTASQPGVIGGAAIPASPSASASSTGSSSNEASGGSAGSTGTPQNGALGTGSSGVTQPQRKSRVREKDPRSNLIPRTCVLWINQGRINAVYHELLKLDVNEFPNSAAVALRVFVELTVDHHAVANSLITDQQLMSTPLAGKLKTLVDFLHSSGMIDIQLKRAIHKVADGGGRLSTVTFNQYVHNQFAHPTASELRTSWDELEPFMKVLWKK